MIAGIRGLLIVAAIVLLRLPLDAQEPLRVAGLADGRDAAERGSVATSFLAGFAGGVPIGISGAHYLSAGRTEARAAPAVAGAAVLIGAAVVIHIGTTPPPPPRPEPEGGTVDAYAAGFREGFESRLRTRRRNALALGSFVGMGVGVVTWSLLRRATDRY